MMRNMRTGLITALAVLVLAALLLGGWAVLLLSEKQDGGPDKAALIKEYRQVCDEQLALGAYGAAADYAEKLCSLEDSLENRLLQAAVYELKGDLSAYARCLNAMLARWPKQTGLYERLCSCYFSQNAFSRCVETGLAAYRQDCFSEAVATLYFDAAYRTRIASDPLDSAESFRDGYGRMALEGRWYYVNDRLELVSGPYDWCDDARSPVLGVQDGEKAGFLTMDGSLYMDSAQRYTRVWSLCEGLAKVQRDGLFYFVDDACREVLGPYEAASSFYNGVAAVRSGETWSLIDTGGRQRGGVFQALAIGAGDDCSRCGVVFASTGGGYDLYGTDGTLIAQTGFEAVRPFAGDVYADAKKDWLWGFVDAKGQWLLEPQYADTRAFGSGLAAVCVDGLWGFIRTSGRMVISPQFEDAGCFSAENIAPVKQDGRWYYLTLPYME